MKFKIKRILAVMLVFCMMMGVMPNMLMTAHAGSTVNITKAADKDIPDIDATLVYECGDSVSIPMSVEGGTEPYTWSFVNENYGGYSIDSSTGLITGTAPATQGEKTLFVEVEDSNGADDQVRVHILTLSSFEDFQPEITTTSLANGSVGDDYVNAIEYNTTSKYVHATYECEVEGALPKGLSIDKSGATGFVLKGTPLEAGTFSFTVKIIIDIEGKLFTDTQSLTLNVSGTALGDIGTGEGSIGFITQTLEEGKVGAPYFDAPKTSPAGGKYSITSGNLPAGLSMESNGNISGTPTTAEECTFTVKVESSRYGYASRQYTIKINPADEGSEGGEDEVIVEITKDSLKAGKVGKFYMDGITSTPAGNTVTLESGKLPEGIELQENGNVIGTPTEAGTFTFTVKATASGGEYATKQYTLVIEGDGSGEGGEDEVIVEITKDSLKAGKVGKFYMDGITSTPAGNTVTLESGKLPAGINLQENGNVIGTPTDAGTFTFTVKATAPGGEYATKQYTLVIEGDGSGEGGDDVCYHPESKVNVEYDATGHWDVCECGKLEKVVAPHEYDNDQDTTCNECEFIREIEGGDVTPTISIPETLALKVGESSTLTATGDYEGYTLSWSSDNEAVATVDENGKVTAVAAGTANITVTLDAGATRTTISDTCVVTVTEATPEITKYNATVNNGTGDGEYAAGEIVTITADVPAEGNVFDKWIVVDGTVTFTDATKAETTFTMPEGDVVVEATYKNDGGSGEVIRAYDIEVVNGKSYAAAGAEITMAEEGTKITIKADAAAEGKEFDKWVVVSGTITLADANKAETTFDMPAERVQVTATYKDKEVTPPADDDGDQDDDKEEEPTKPTEPQKPSDNPQTGDNSNIFMWFALLFVSAVGIAVTTVLGKKRFFVK